jgi:PAS domain S-box-containing protein
VKNDPDSHTIARGMSANQPPARKSAEELENKLRWAQESQALAIRVLTLLSRQISPDDIIREIVAMVKEFTGFEAVGIRLREGDDFPYFETKGFPDCFVKAESHLCARSECGEIIRDATGNPLMECMCGNVLQGRTDPSFHFFTPGGSFWTNCTTQLLASTTEAERQSRTRDRCNGEGYESVALIPIRSDRETIGLLQLNDSRPNCFVLEMMQFFEGIGASIAIVLEHKRVAQDRDRLFNLSLDMLCIAGFDGFFKQVNPAFTKTLGWTKEELLSKPWIEFVHPDDREKTIATASRLIAGESLHLFRNRYRCKDGKYRWISWNGFPIQGEDLIFAVARDVTEQKETEEDLERVKNELETRVAKRTAALEEANRKLVSEISERERATSALRESEEKYRLVVEKAQEGILIARDGMLLFVNPKTAEILGRSEQEILSTTFMEFIHPDDRAMVQRYHERRMKGEFAPAHYSLRLIGGDGGLKWVEIDSASVTYAGKLAALVFISEITDRVRMEEALRESEERYRILVEESFDGMFIQKGSRIVFANSRLHEMLGYSPGALEGLDHWIVYHRDYHALTRARAIARMRGEDVVSQYEVKLQRTDGTCLDGEISAREVKVKGEPGVIVWVRDISERKRVEESQRRLAKAVEQAGEAVVITDADGKIQYVNPAFERITGYAEEEVIGLDPRILKSGEHDQEFYQNLWATIGGGRVWKGRIINRKKDGTLYHEDSTISPVRDADGKIVNYVAVKRDITEHLQLTRQLVQAQRMEAIGTLAGGIAHDFNNLLTVILGFSELLLIGKDERDPSYADLQKVNLAARNGADLVQRILAFSRKKEMNPKPLDLNHEIEQVKKLLTRIVPKMIDIDLVLSDELQPVNADPVQIEQVLMNLAVNARDAMPDGGKLTIETKNAVLDDEYCRTHLEAKPGYYVLLSVSDTGQGMDRQTLNHIFEPFFTTKEKGRGTGLGLSMVYGIVKQHQGQITCYSELGYGTTFRIYLPAIDSETKSEPLTSKSGLMLGSETVLLVDDEEMIRGLGKRILERFGYTVLTATNGREALDVFEKQRTRIDLVILDLIMPEMGGRQCLDALLKLDPNVKVLIASGYSDTGQTGDMTETAAKGFVSKPYQMKQMLEAVRKALGQE